MKPHKHAAVIKAWADGAEIEFRGNEEAEWSASVVPSWREDFQYRVKPKTLKYRRYLWAGFEASFVGIVNSNSPIRKPSGVEVETDFIRWIDTEWQEVEV